MNPTPEQSVKIDKARKEYELTTKDADEAERRWWVARNKQNMAYYVLVAAIEEAATNPQK